MTADEVRAKQQPERERIAAILAVEKPCTKPGSRLARWRDERERARDKLECLDAVLAVVERGEDPKEVLPAYVLSAAGEDDDEPL